MADRLENDKRLLCVVYGGGHVLAVLPALAELRARGWSVDLLALTTAFETARAAGFSPWRAADFLGEGDSNILSYGEQLADAFGGGGLIPHEETVAYLGLGYADLVAHHGSKQAQRIYEAQGRKAFRHVLLATRAIERSRPNVVLTTNSPRAEQAAINVAQEKGIPTVVLNDMFVSPASPWMLDPHYADLMLVLNDSVKDDLIEAGRSSEKIFVTGNPALAPMQKLERFPSDRESDRPRVLFADQQALPGDETLFDDMRTGLSELAVRRPDLEIVVRLHPSQKGQDFWVVDPLKLDRAPSPFESLGNTDVVLTFGSTFGLEAAIGGVPVVEIIGNKISDATCFYERGIAVTRATPQTIEGAIATAMAAEVSTVSIMPVDPKRRVADAIESIGLRENLV